MGSSATPTRAVAAVALGGVRSGLTFPLLHRTVSCDKAPRCRLADRRCLSFEHGRGQLSSSLTLPLTTALRLRPLGRGGDIRRKARNRRSARPFADGPITGIGSQKTMNP